MRRELGQAAVWAVMIILLSVAVPVGFLMALITMDRGWVVVVFVGIVGRFVLWGLYKRLFPQLHVSAQVEARKLLERKQNERSVDERACEIVEQRTGWPAYMAERDDWERAKEQARRELRG